MFKSVKTVESNISVDLEEPLTASACSQLILEIMKYIMYQKQQIPFSCDTLVKLHSNTKPTSRNFSSMQKLINSLEMTNNQLSNELNLKSCEVKEILIMIGATIFSSKLCLKLELPSILSDEKHVDKAHPYRKSLLKVMRSILDCEEFQDELSMPLNPTNTFVLVLKKDLNKTSPFFIPKPQFTLPIQNTKCLNIRLNYNGKVSCSCRNMFSRFPIYNDFSMIDHSVETKSRDRSTSKKSTNSECDVPYQWYQSKEIFKGFKFIR